MYSTTDLTPIAPQVPLPNPSQDMTPRSAWMPDLPLTILAAMMFIVPAVGMPSQLVLQDTLKSAMVALGVLLAALLLLWCQLRVPKPLVWHGLIALPLALMAYALGSMAWAHTYLAGAEAARWFVLAVLLWLSLQLPDQATLPKLVRGIHAGLLAASLWVVLQFLFDFDFFAQAVHPASTFINRNFFSEYAVCALPFALWALLQSPPSRWLPVNAFTPVLPVVAVMMTGTRSALVAMLALAIATPVIVWRFREQWAVALWSRTQCVAALLVFLVGVAGLGSLPCGNANLLKEHTGNTALERSFFRTASIATPSEYTEGTFSVRSSMWMATARMVADNPLAGVGAGAWEVQIPLYQRDNTVRETDYYAHNEYLQLLSEYGAVIGGLFLACLLAYLLLATRTTWGLTGDSQTEGPPRAFALASLMALAIVSAAGFPWHLAPTGALFMLSLGVLASSDARLGLHKQFYITVARWRPLYVAIGIFLMGVALTMAIYISVQAVRAESRFMRAMALAVSLVQEPPGTTTSAADRKAELLLDMREGIAINPHYRKLVPMTAGMLATSGDFSNAVWIWQSVAQSRPHIAELWAYLALGYSREGDHAHALESVEQLQRLKPDTPGTVAVEATVLSNAGQQENAVQKISACLDRGQYDYELIQTAYAIAYKAGQWALAIRALELRNAHWPDQAANGYFSLGMLYANPALNDATRALAAFKAGLASVPLAEQRQYLEQVPQPYRSQM